MSAPGAELTDLTTALNQGGATVEPSILPNRQRRDCRTYPTSNKKYLCRADHAGDVVSVMIGGGQAPISTTKARGLCMIGLLRHAAHEA